MTANRSRIQMLSDFMEGLNHMEGAASQLVSGRSNPKWMAIRDMLDMIKNGIDVKTVIGAQKH